MNYDKDASVCGLSFKGTSREVLLAPSDTTKFVVTVNSEFIVESQSNIRFKKIIESNYATFDGQIPYFLARLKGQKVEKISGSDFIYDIAELCRSKNESLFLLGGNEDSNSKAIQFFRTQYKINCDGYSPPYEGYPFSDINSKAIENYLIDFRPQHLFVGFGALKQEYWIEDNFELLQKIGVKTVVGSGGTFEFVSGTITRAPKFLQTFGLEGVYRLFKQPKLFRVLRLLRSFKIFQYFFVHDLLKSTSTKFN